MGVPEVLYKYMSAEFGTQPLAQVPLFQFSVWIKLFPQQSRK